jgi:hypothetical protein
VSTTQRMHPTATVLPHRGGRHSRARRQLIVTLVAGLIGLAGIIAALLIPGGEGLAGLGLDGLALPGAAPSAAARRIPAEQAGFTDGGPPDGSVLARRAPIAPTAPVFLPEQVAGLGRFPLAEDPSLATGWQKKVTKAAGGAAISARTYGTPDQTRTVRVAAARTDLTGTLHLTWPADEGTAVGANRCTQYVRPAPDSEAKVRDGVVICWRRTPGLSAYALLISTNRPVSAAEGSAALDEVWAWASAP